MKVAVGTKNKAKLKAVEKVILDTLSHEIELLSISVASNVADQPFSEEETRQGAINRAIAAREQTGATIGFGLEGGVKWIGQALYLCNWAALSTEETVYTAAGAQIPLPKEVAQALLTGEELGPIMDRYVGVSDTRQNAGAIGVFTDGLIDRAEMFEPIVMMLVGQYRYWAKQ